MNFKTTIINVCITAILFVGYHFLFQKNAVMSFAYVDSSKLMTDYKGMSDVKKVLESKEKILQTNLDTLTQELQNDIKKYEKDRSGMNDREKKTTEELIGRKQQQYMQYKDASKNKAMEDEQKLTNDVLQKVNKIIQDYGKANHYSIIFGTTSGNIVYANDGINITDQVLAILNAQYDQNKK